MLFLQDFSQIEVLLVHRAALVVNFVNVLDSEGVVARDEVDVLHPFAVYFVVSEKNHALLFPLSV